MRELKREEYGMISGGTDLGPVHVYAIDPRSTIPGVYFPSAGTGNGPRGMGEGGGGGKVHATFGPNGNVTSVTLQCPTGTSPSITTGGGNLTVGAGAILKALHVTGGASGGGGSITCHR